MHIVTKILIVFASLLAILLAALVIPLASNADAVTSAYKNEQAAKVAAQSGQANAERLYSELSAGVEAQKAALRGEADAALGQVRSLQTERATLIDARKTAEGQLEGMKSRLDSLVVASETQSSLIKSLKDELDAARKAGLDSSKQLAEIVERYNEAERLLQVANQTSRSLKEQLEEMRMSAEQAKSGGAATVSDRGYQSSGPLVSGRVIRVMKGPAGDDLAAINLGTSSGLKPNMRLSIVRDGFVADLVLINVDMNEAVGRVNTLGRAVSVQAEDRVVTRLD